MALLNEDEPPPTSAQIVAAQEEITELMEALKDTQELNEQLRSERDELKRGSG